MLVFFKLFNSIKSEHEADELARLELESLLGTSRLGTVSNFADELAEEPLRQLAAGAGERIQDAITYELPYGKTQGYRAETSKPSVLLTLMRRLAYTREIYVVAVQGETPALLSTLNGNVEMAVNTVVYRTEGATAVRLVTNQYFLEKTEYISKLSRNEKEVEQNVDILLHYPTRDLYRIPASSTLSVGKRLEDYFAIREEPSLYLTHYMHPYKGKFHPKMARALLNIVMPQDKGCAMDNFAGSGTLLVEATLMGIDSVGVDINPLSALMSKVKCECLLLEPKELKAALESYIAALRKRGEGPIFAREEPPALEVASIEDVKLDRYVRGYAPLASIVRTAQDTLPGKPGEPVHDFFLLALSGTISDLTRRTTSAFIAAFEERAWDLYLRAVIFQTLNKALRITPGRSWSYTGDTRDMPKAIKPESITAIVNSPPYSTALDYIKNDYPQLKLLQLVTDMEQLQRNMMGNPRVNYDRSSVQERMELSEHNPLRVSKTARWAIDLLRKGGRANESYRCFKFFDDMYATLREMHRVLAHGGKAAIIIGPNHFKIGSRFHSVPNDTVVEELASSIGLHPYREGIRRNLQKTSSGNIRTETILLLQKD